MTVSQHCHNVARTRPRLARDTSPCLFLWSGTDHVWKAMQNMSRWPWSRAWIRPSHSSLSLSGNYKVCLCVSGLHNAPKSSPSFVHVGCLQRWRNTAAASQSFYVCPQCLYHYRFARTRVVGIATNPVVIGAISTTFFVLLTLLSSSLTTYFISIFQGDTYYYSVWYVHPFDVARQLVREIWCIWGTSHILI